MLVSEILIISGTTIRVIFQNSVTNMFVMYITGLAGKEEQLMLIT